MFTVFYTAHFSRRVRGLEAELQEEVLEKIELFKVQKNWSTLKVHKLKGKFNGYFAFSVNYKTRIVYRYLSKNEIALVTFGDHDVYK